MKRILFFIAILAALAFCILLFSHRQAPKQIVAPRTSFPVTNTVPPPPISNVPLQAAPTTNAFVRPDYIDEDHWNQLMLVRQLALEQNQPVEFYAHVVDQNGQPLEGAKLHVILSRTDEKMFETTNFFSRQMGDEVLNVPLELVSDSDGWIRLSNVTGNFLRVESLTKEGYSGKDYYGGISFEPGGRRNPSSDIQMTNAWNPQKGYIFHLQKIEGK